MSFLSGLLRLLATLVNHKGSPLGKLLSDGVGIPILGVPLSFTYSTAGMWLWLFVVIVLSALASALPARNASRLTVREVLAYE